MEASVLAFPSKQRRKAKSVDAPAAWLDLVASIGTLKPHEIIGIADAGDFRERNEHLQLLAAAFDRYVYAFGAEMRSHAQDGFDMKVFTARMADDLEGNATSELERNAVYLENGGGY